MTDWWEERRRADADEATIWTDCPRRPVHGPRPVGGRVCHWCGGPLPLRRQAWCSQECVVAFTSNHEWGAARYAAVKRDDYRCVRCGFDGLVWLWCVDCDHGVSAPEARSHLGHRLGRVDTSGLEVNHVIPRDGAGYHKGCHHHLDGLETLCRPCHRTTTAEQRGYRRPMVEAATAQLGL